MQQEARPRLPSALLAALLLAGLASILPAAANNTPYETTLTKAYPEDYESFSTTGVNPTSPWGTYTTAGTGTYLIATGSNCDGTRCLAVADTISANFSADFNNDATGVNLCTAGQAITFRFALSAGITLNQAWHLRVATSGASTLANPANSIDLALTGSLAATEATSIVLNSNTGTQTPVSLGSYTAPGQVIVTLDTMNCAGSTPSIHYTVNGGGLSATGTFTANAAVVGDFDSIQVASSSTALPSNTVDLDDLNWTGAPLPAPTLTSVTPPRGTALGGTSVTLAGTGFKAGASVTFGGSAATGVSVPSGTSITATTPAHSAGFVSVVVTNPDGQQGSLTNGFLYDPAPSPVIQSINPSSGITAGGTLVNITGLNFQSGFNVTFDGIPAFTTAYVSSTFVQATSPPHAAGSVILQLTNPDGQTSTAQYLYTTSSGGAGSGDNGTGTTTTINPSAFANSGYHPDIDINGATVAIVHRNVGNALILTYSNDNGTTWNDRAVGATVAYNAARIFAFNSTSFGILVNFAANAPTYYLSNDGGNSWATVQLPLGFTCGIGLFCDVPTTTRAFDAIRGPGNLLYLTYSMGKAGTSCGGAANLECGAAYLYTSSNNGASWGATARYWNYFYDSGATIEDVQPSIYVNADTSGGVIFNTRAQLYRGLFSAGGGFTTTTHPGAAYVDEQPGLNDPLTPLVNYGYGVRSARNGDDIAFRDGTNAAYLGVLQPGGTYFFYQYAGQQTAFYLDAYSTPDSIGAISAIGGDARLLKTSDRAGTFLNVTLHNQVVDNDPAVGVNCNNILTAFRNNQTGRLQVVRLNDPTPCAASNGTTNMVCIWCSARGNTNFGYDYVKDVDTDNTQGGKCVGNTETRFSVDIVPCYRFLGDANNFAYLGKGFTPGQTHVASYFNIEAATDGVPSVYRSAFSAVAGTPNSTNKGNGLDTQQFSEHVEARFLEVDNDWNVQIYHVSTSHNITTLTKLGSAFIGDAPNSPRFYNFSVDSVANRAYVKHSIGTDGAGTMEEADLFPGGIALPSYWQGQKFLSHWFIGYATDTFFNNDAATRLDPGDGLALSTCLYAFTVPNNQLPMASGDQGRIPPNDADGDGTPDDLDPDDDNDGTPDPLDPTPGTGSPSGAGNDGAAQSTGGGVLIPDTPIPPGWTVAAFNGFLGVILMAAIGGGTWFIFNRHWAAFVIGSMTGFLLALLFQLFSLWILIVVVVISTAIIFLRIKQSAGASG